MRYLIAFAIAASCSLAQASNFVSLHQAALKIALPPSAGSYVYPIDARIGFKQQYSPTGISGCAIGYATGGCAFPGGGSLALPEFIGYQLQSSEFKVFIPAGAKSFMFSGYAPQGAQSAFVLRYGREPVRGSSLSSAEYQAAMRNERIDTSFARLVAEGTDELVVHDGGGTLRFVGGPLDANKSSTAQGKWLYVRQLSGAPLYDVQGGIDVDMPKYASGYANIKWNSSTYPDPVEETSPAGTVSPVVTPTPDAPTTVTLGTAVASGAGQPLKLDVTLTQTAALLASSRTASVWFAARIPAGGFFT